MSTSKKKTTNTRQVSLAAESTDSDLSPHEDQIQSLMNAFNFSRAKAEEEVGRLNQIAQSPSAVDESQEIIKFYTSFLIILNTSYTDKDSKLNEQLRGDPSAHREPTQPSKISGVVAASAGHIVKLRAAARFQ